ncbi:hypothetical protein [Bradyrhizobium sp. CCBAU 65884]|uniref:hypothetical protein n=1 Tax=Bradyrhizobium sp. CCBAU 65884 TaxID=722477 RepID=UPI0023069E66|nr:hypothetical protein [Bradyrhizobium sp. CCBAU 65884]
MSMEVSPAHDGFIVFRRGDTKKRINITTERYRLTVQKWLEIDKLIGLAGARSLRDLSAEIDADGDLRSLTFEPEDVNYPGTKISLPGGTITFEKPYTREPLADLIAYQQCMEAIASRRTFLHRLFSLLDSEEANRIANPEMYVSLFQLSGRQVVESMAVHYRKIFELMIYACWTAFEPRMSISYETNQAKAIYRSLRANFPHEQTFMVPIFANSFEPIDPQKRKGFEFDELMEAYDYSSTIVHENGPYRPPFDELSALKRFVEWNSRLLTVSALHRVQISPSEFVFCRCRGDGKVFVWIDDKRPKMVPQDAFEGATRRTL